MTTDGWLWDAERNEWWHPETCVVILDEDMPWELVPRCTHQAPVPPWFEFVPDWMLSVVPVVPLQLP